MFPVPVLENKLWLFEWYEGVSLKRGEKWGRGSWDLGM